MTKDKTIHDLALHEVHPITPHLDVMRVPGGLLYIFWEVCAQRKVGHTQFVPYSDEFAPEKEKHPGYEDEFRDVPFCLEGEHFFAKDSSHTKLMCTKCGYTRNNKPSA